MDPNVVNSLLLKLRSKKWDDLDKFERVIRTELKSLENSIQQKRGNIIRWEEEILKCEGALNQTVDLYIAYVGTQNEPEENLEDEEPSEGDPAHTG
jgi:hypothetical protein